jgi:hypothetical protein
LFPFHTGIKFDVVADFFNKFVDKNTSQPDKKVFLSRKKIAPQKSQHFANFSHTIDDRIDDHTELEKIFFDYGFEIIYPEDFKNFKEQIEFFKTVKVLVSLTSSGLVNATFMEPGSTVIEIVTPLLTVSPLINDEYFKQYNIDPTQKENALDFSYIHEVHMFYHAMSFMKNMLYVAIPNHRRSASEINDFVKNNQILQNILNNE